MILYASPTFLFRNQCPRHLDEILKKLRQCGFDGFELYGMFGYSAEELKAICQQNGMLVTCDHIPYEEFSVHTEECIKARAALGVKYLTVDRISETLLPSSKLWSNTVKEIHRIGRVCRDYGIQLLYHSHGFDLIRKAAGLPILDSILDDTDPELLKFQPDLGWIQRGGGDSSFYLNKYKKRCPVIHFKDYYASSPLLLESPFILGEKRGGKEFHDFEFRPSGYGIMNYPALIPLVLQCNPEWITTDHDMSYERDTYQDMAMSLRYVKELVSLYPA